MTTLAQPLAYTVRDCASALRCSERTIRRAIGAGKLRVVRVGRLVRVPVESLRQFMEGAQASGPVRPFIPSDCYKSDERRTKSKPELNAAKGITQVASSSEEENRFCRTQLALNGRTEAKLKENGNESDSPEYLSQQ